MDKKSKILLKIFLILIILSAVMTYYKYMILREFDVVDTTIEEIVE